MDDSSIQLKSLRLLFSLARLPKSRVFGKFPRAGPATVIEDRTVLFICNIEGVCRYEDGTLLSSRHLWQVALNYGRSVT
jgi:hypothetical protein